MGSAHSREGCAGAVTGPERLGRPDSARATAERVATLFATVSTRADTALASDPDGTFWVSLTPRNEEAASVEARIEGRLLTLVIGRLATFEFPFWSKRAEIDDHCMRDIEAIVTGVARGGLVERLDDVETPMAGSATVATGTLGTVSTSRGPLLRNRFRRRQWVIRRYEPY